jgi:hypothetical protein
MNVISSSIIPVDPSSLFYDGYGLSDQNIIPSENFVGNFTPDKDKIEFFVYDNNLNLISADYNFNNWKVSQDPTIIQNGDITTLELDPSNDLILKGFSIGELYAVYNFITPELSSSISQKYFISDISSDRTEIRLKSNYLTNEDIESSFNELKQKLNSSNYFDEFYLNFSENEYEICVNIQLENANSPYSVIVKLYEPLPAQYQLKDELFVVSKPAETQAYKVSFFNEYTSPDDLTYLKGPNTNLNIKDFVNNSTDYKTKTDLLNTTLSGSSYQLKNYLNNKGISITPNYSIDTFEEFVHFSSAKQRILNFVSKVEQIQLYENDLNTLYSITGSTSSSLSVSSSISNINLNIENIITNFDGYEYYLYYISGSSSYPKSGSYFPYTLLPTTSSNVLTWLGSDDINNQYYGGILLSASFYDNKNQDYLYYTIPDFIKENNDNNQYIEFVNMVGQHFDEIWLYTKAVTDKLNSTNVLDKGASLDIVNDVVSSFGYDGFSNNYDNHDNYIGLLGISPSGEFTPPTGSELITNYIAVNSDKITNYWFNNTYSNSGYVQQQVNYGFPYAIDKISKEIYKRLYHNMAYLVKKKGTISGLRQLINIWGVPDTILRINEFGGKNKDKVNDYEAWYNRFSYAYTPSLGLQNTPNSNVVIPWQPLYRNLLADGKTILPDCLMFRFKAPSIPTGVYATQSLLVKKSDGDFTNNNFDFGIQLIQSGSITAAPYLGAPVSDYSKYGVLKFWLSGSASASSDIYLPFFDGNWWSIMLQRNQHNEYNNNNLDVTYTLYAKSKIYDGYDGNKIGYQGSSSLVVNDPSTRNLINSSWNYYNTSSVDGIYLGGFISGSYVGRNNVATSGSPVGTRKSPLSTIISPNSFQEFRYYGNPITEEMFNDYVMNPESIMGVNITGSLSSFDILNFRAPLGNELENTLISFHPAVSAMAESLITSSFYYSSSLLVTSSNYDIFYYNGVATSSRYFTETNVETYYLDQSSLGIRNPINDKIKIVDNFNYGNVLSLNRSIQQTYPINKKYTEDVNNLEVSFSPQDEINDDIVQTFGYQPLSDVLSDPRFISSSLNYYPKLKNISVDYFKKYSKGNIYDYIRLIKYIDNSLFKAIKNYVPARTSVSTGIVIKQHLLERNRYRIPQVTPSTNLTTIFGIPDSRKDITLTASIKAESISGSTGGSVEKYNYIGNPNFYQLPITQSWNNIFDTPLGLQNIIENSQKEFYNGEYSGSELVASNGELNANNPFKYPNNSEIRYDVKFFAFSAPSQTLSPPSAVFLPEQDYINGVFVSSPITPPANRVFTNPNSGNINLYADDNNYIKYIKVNLSSLNGVDLSNTLINCNIITIITSFATFKCIITNRQFRGNYWLFTIKQGYPNEFILLNQGERSNNSLIIFDPLSPPGTSFDNSNYNAILNNYNDNRKNSFLMDVDYSTNTVVPVNYQSILSSSATRAQTPDSNYTSHRVINSRYLGSKNYSVNYNLYTPSSSLVNFINGDTGSWNGDKSYGKIAAVDKYPNYFAHFKTSYTNLEVFNTTTFNIDMLIESPQNSIQGTKSYNPSTIKLDGSNNNLYLTSNNFEKNRQLTIINNPVSGSINYLNSPAKINNIIQGGLEYQLVVGNEISNNASVLTCSFATSSWVLLDSYNILPDVSKGYLQTGSNEFILRGYTSEATSSINQGSIDYTLIQGSGLGLIHSYNYAVKNQITASIITNYLGTGFDLYFLGIPQNTFIDPTDPSNYFNFTPLATGMSQYNNFNIPFLIEPGDEIRISWSTPPNVKHYDFTVIGITNQLTSPPLHDLQSPYQGAYYPPGSSCFISSTSVFDVIKVYPDPSTLNIPNGIIDSFTIRRRVGADNKVIIFQIPPINSQGVLTPSGDGFIIPNDFSEIQKKNVSTIINQLKSQNAFN